MFKFVAICALLATASTQHHGHSHGHGQSHGHGHGHGPVQSHSVSNNHASSDDVHAEIKHYDSDVHEHGFQYAFETTNHIKAVAEGDEHGNVRGDFQWISPEGEHIEVNYVADENGYQPHSDVLPTPHPIPEAILKSLEYIASHPHDEFPVHHEHRL